ncbi:Permease of the drug/metabolite transporter (DMT) superfamily [Paenibacillus sp. yr247]|uniref:DMT family transporter n=1 Tax=Paenibacillus sp. yr247 TaxID=1761880 RepID=UPI00088B1CB7|nr:DMT family transporter [Paenibacillus sp. yr247]SDO33115.1 Permease of the drug/metabolite transporter (DMT) superfamily [Paenibacillus sp. yr247]
MSKLFIYIGLIAVVMCWGFNVVATKILVSFFQPITMTAFRIFIAGVVVLLVLKFMKLLRSMTWKEVRLICVAALFNVVGHQLFLAVGLTKTSASNTGLILGLSPLLTAILAVLILGDRFTSYRVVGIICGFIGVVFIVLNGSLDTAAISIGDFYIFLSVLSQAVSFIFIKKAATTLDPRVLTGWMLIVGSLILLGISLIIEPHGFNSFSKGTFEVWSIFLTSAVFASGLGHMFYNNAIQRLGAAQTAIFINLSPFFALLGNYLFLGEVVTVLQMLGFSFIIIGVINGTESIDKKGMTYLKELVRNKKRYTR